MKEFCKLLSTISSGLNHRAISSSQMITLVDTTALSLKLKEINQIRKSMYV